MNYLATGGQGGGHGPGQDDSGDAAGAGAGFITAAVDARAANDTMSTSFKTRTGSLL